MHDGDAFGVDGAEIGVFEQVDEKRLGGLLQGLDRLRLPAQDLAVRHEVDGDLADEAGEGELEEEQVGAALVAADLLERVGAGLVAVLFAGGSGIAGGDA